MHLRAARSLSVTRHTPFDFKTSVDPTNSFKYGVKGSDERLWRSFATPGRVRIATGSDPIITFKENGSVSAPSTIIIESDVSGACERWTATVSTIGRTQLAHERVN